VTASVGAKQAAEPGGDPARPGRLQQYWPALRYSASVYLVVRVALFLLGAAAWGLTSEHASVAPAGPIPLLTNGWHNAITGWNKQDSLWFLYIAQHGYSAGNESAAFYPAYPILIRLVGYLCFGHLLVAAYLVSNGALLAALVVLYRLTEREFDSAIARRTVLYLCLFPTAFFMFDTYSEALFLLATVSALYLARQRRWAWAGVAGVVATLTRSAGVVVVLALAAEAIHQAVEDRRAMAAGDQPDGDGRRIVSSAVARLAASALPLAGVGAYLLYWQVRFHDWYQPISIEHVDWGRDFTAPWVTLWRGLRLAWQYGPVGDAGWWTLDFVLVAIGLVLGVWVARRARPVYAVYTWASILFFLFAEWPGRPLGSDPRYLLPIFPLVWPLAIAGRRQGTHDAVVALSAASMAIVGWLFLSTTLVF
jgi:hypothetical protein